MLQVMINSRHQDALNRARAATQQTIFALRSNENLELAAMDLRDLRIVSAAGVRLGGEQGHEIIADATDAKNGAALSVVQWLRFGSVGYLQILGIARRDTWDAVLPRMRVVRDRIAIK